MQVKHKDDKKSALEKNEQHGKDEFQSFCETGNVRTPSTMKRQIEEINLPNGLTMHIWDASRVIAADTTSVILIVTIQMELKADYFVETDHYRLTTSVFGKEMPYEYRKERTFVKTRDAGAVFQELLETFKADALPYLARATFPKQFARSKHREILNNPYRYREYLEQGI